MDEMTKIRNLLLQNQKIIRYASENVSFPSSFSEEAIQEYKETESKVSEISIKWDKIKLEYKKRGDDFVTSSLDGMAEKLALAVKRKDIVDELNTELSIGKTIKLSGNRFLVNTRNLTINKQGMRFKGEVNASTGSIGGFKISGNTLVGAENSSIGSGTIETSYMNLRGATADLIDCNPDNIAGKPVVMTSNRRIDKESKDGSTTSFKGELYVTGVIDATYGWNQEIDSDGEQHGTLPSFSFDVVHVKGACTLKSKGGTTSPANRARCDKIEAEGKDEWSDRRLKENIKDIDGEKVVELFKKARPVEYQRIGKEEKNYGYIAQELDKAFLDVGLRSIVKKEGEFYCIPYTELIPLRVKMIQELYRRIKDGSEGKGFGESSGTT